jgi:hypothetical protein
MPDEIHTCYRGPVCEHPEAIHEMGENDQGQLVIVHQDCHESCRAIREDSAAACQPCFSRAIAEEEEALEIEELLKTIEEEHGNGTTSN